MSHRFQHRRSSRVVATRARERVDSELETLAAGSHGDAKRFVSRVSTHARNIELKRWTCLPRRWLTRRRSGMTFTRCRGNGAAAETERRKEKESASRLGSRAVFPLIRPESKSQSPAASVSPSVSKYQYSVCSLLSELNYRSCRAASCRRASVRVRVAFTLRVSAACCRLARLLL
jgi:hypothetical protein